MNLFLVLVFAVIIVGFIDLFYRNPKPDEGSEFDSVDIDEPPDATN